MRIFSHGVHHAWSRRTSVRAVRESLLKRAKAGPELNKSQQPITAVADTRTITQKREREREREREGGRERGREREREREGGEEKKENNNNNSILKRKRNKTTIRK